MPGMSAQHLSCCLTYRMLQTWRICTNNHAEVHQSRGLVTVAAVAVLQHVLLCLLHLKTHSQAGCVSTYWQNAGTSSSSSSSSLCVLAAMTAVSCGCGLAPCLKLLLLCMLLLYKGPHPSWCQATQVRMVWLTALRSNTAGTTIQDQVHSDIVAVLRQSSAHMNPHNHSSVLSCPRCWCLQGHVAS